MNLKVVYATNTKITIEKINRKSFDRFLVETQGYLIEKNNHFRMMNLEDGKWLQLDGGYKIPYDASKTLRELQLAMRDELQSPVFSELWENLHHQGDVGLASYYSVPHLISICIKLNSYDYNFIGLVVLIELCRVNGGNPPVPNDFEQEYLSSLKKFGEYLRENLKNISDADSIRSTLALFAINKGQTKLGRAIDLLDESAIDEFLKQY